MGKSCVTGLTLLAVLVALSSSFSPSHVRTRPPGPRLRCDQRGHALHARTACAKLCATIAPEEGTRPRVLECHGCRRTFATRNALFRHLRGEDATSGDCPLSAAARTAEEELRRTVVVRYGYLADGGAGGRSAPPTNEAVATAIHSGFLRLATAFAKHNVTRPERGEEEDAPARTSALAHSTATKLRRPSLRQDGEVRGAASEVASFNYRLRGTPMTIKRWKAYVVGGQLQRDLQTWLRENCAPVCQVHHLDALVLPSVKFYAERHATQISYRYLLPIKWILPDMVGAEDLAQLHGWWNKIASESMTHRQHQDRRRSRGSSPDFVRALKRSLKAVESRTVPNRRRRRQAEATTDAAREEVAGASAAPRLSPGRFGQLWRKERRCWSNFAHQSLTGMESSPCHEAAWKSLDSAKIAGLTRHDSSNASLDDMHIILEFQGEGFVMGQLPLLVSSIVAMTNGWLPLHFFDLATRPDVYMPVSLAPPCVDRRLYFHSARYHFHELLTGSAGGNEEGSRAQFADTMRTGSEEELKWEEELRGRLAREATSSDREAEEEWLLELRDVVAPRLLRQMQKVEADALAEQSLPIESSPALSTALPPVDTDAPAGAFATTLELLRDIVARDAWPATSDGRSRVIKMPGGPAGHVLAVKTKKKALASAFPGRAVAAGSFSVVNERAWGREDVPRANAMFPELTRAVFDLEEEIIRRASPLPAAEGITTSRSSSAPRRAPSTHCAVNRNAQFTPHVDSGHGRGQTLSMIVGLGNYTGENTILYYFVDIGVSF